MISKQSDHNNIMEKWLYEGRENFLWILFKKLNKTNKKRCFVSGLLCYLQLQLKCSSIRVPWVGGHNDQCGFWFIWPLPMCPEHSGEEKGLSCQLVTTSSICWRRNKSEKLIRLPEKVRFKNHRTASLLCTDDEVLSASSCHDLQCLLGQYAAKCVAAGMKISTSKPEVMVFDRKISLISLGWWRDPASSGGAQVSLGFVYK